MNRRSILALFGGGAASAVSGVSVKEAAKAMGAENALVVGGPTTLVNTPTGQAGCTGPLDHSVIRRIWRARERAQSGTHNMPPHISTKKSWSLVFKESVHAREIDVLDALVEKIERDEDFAGHVARLMGLDK